jgi:O-antigen/teichoic acid export membrane protein
MSVEHMNPSTTKTEAGEKAIFVEEPACSSGNGLPSKRGSDSAWKLPAAVQKLIPWVHKGGLTIVDQGFISGSNFMVSILLARWLSPDEYGAYAIAFGIYMLLSLVYQSLMLEPMGVFGGSIFRGNLRGYLRSLVWVHVALSVTSCAALVIAWAVAHRIGSGGAVTGALAGIAFALPGLMLFSLARRSFYMELSPAPAAAGAFIYSALVLAGLYVVYQHALLSPFSAFLLIGVGALVTGIVLMFRLRSVLGGSGPAPALRETWSRHWRYGGWAFASCIAAWLPSYVYYPILSSFKGMAQSGQLKALMNLTTPFEQTKGALFMLLLPYAARVAERHGKSGTRILGGRLTLLSAGGAIFYWAIIIPLHKPVFQLLYSGRYMEVAHLLPLLALGQVFWSAAYGPSIALRAMESPASVFLAFASATVASLLIGVPATWAYGLKGAIWGSNLADILSLVAVVLVLRHKLATRGSADRSSRTSWLGAKEEVPETLTLGISEEI